MRTGKLTPRTNNTICAARFTGSFGQPNGFGSILEAAVREDGRLVLTCIWKDHLDNSKECMWTIELDSAQRNKLVDLVGQYQPIFVERMEEA